MKKRLVLGLLAALVLAIVGTPARAVDQKAIDKAIEKGVEALRGMRRADGTWPHEQVGATALAGLALLECGAKEDDEDVRRAADAVRKAGTTLTHTYSVSLSILFLDRLGDRDDVPLIQSLTRRLLAGQDANSGGWSYECPRISPGGAAAMPPFAMGFGDNSNTQFAALALWVGHRYGVPIKDALTRLDRRFRTTQMEDGGWTYMPMPRPPGMPANMPLPPGMGSTATMTCAGLLALAITDGATLEIAREKKVKDKAPDISQDKELKKGLEALGAVIDNPKGLKPQQPGAPFAPPGAPFAPAQRVGGRTYYFLWSLERVAVALHLDTIGKKDWYGWGAEILVENQDANGAWNGDFGFCGADTCFALLFLKRANLARDLTAQIQGKVKDPGERMLVGGTGREKLPKKVRSGIENKDSKLIAKPLPRRVGPESARLAERLMQATGARHADLLEQLESGKGPKYTEALAAAIPKLEGEKHRKARQAMADRLTRMKDETLTEYLKDEDAEIRRGAALAVGQKDSKKLVPHLIALLRDPERSVVRAAHASLKALTGKDFGPSAQATREQRDRAVLKWIAWWSKQRKKPAKE